MADQGKWFKLWESALDDQELENLTIHNWYCWARLGTYVKKHGKEGELIIKSPAVALQNLLRLRSFDDVKSVVKVLPGYVLEEMESVTANVTNATVTLKIKCSNWNKYQGDFSGDRVRRFRHRVTANVTVQEEKRRDVEVDERRRDVPPNPQTASRSASSTSPANGTAKPNYKPVPGHYDIPEDKIMGAEEFTKIKQGLKNHSHQSGRSSS